MGNEINAAVICHSGYTYAQRPTAFFVDGERLEVSRVESEWTSPNGRGFKVCTPDGRLFKIIYDEPGEQWSIIPT